MKTKQIIIPAPNMWSKTQDIYITPKGLHRIGYEENYMSILRNKSKKGKAIIEAEMLYREGRKNLRRLVVLIMILGIGLIIYGLVKGIC